MAAASPHAGDGKSVLVTMPKMREMAGQGTNDTVANSHDAGRGPGGVAKQVDMGPYMANLQKRIKSRWTPLKDNVSNRVKLLFKIALNGELSNVSISVPSGNPQADQAALKAVREAAPFPPLPTGADQFAENGKVDIEFTFDYNVFGGGGQNRVHY
jgi:TonB family protein